MEKSQDLTTKMALARKGVPEWKWKGALGVIFLLSLINGYDISNVANIQPRLYEALGRIDLLPWIGLSYSLANFAILSLARKVTYFFDMKWIYLTCIVMFMAGAALAGAAPNMQCVIVGRVIMGFGGAIIQQTNFSYLAVFATTSETPKLVGAVSAMWATGLVVGGPVGSALAENKHATWRWAFYLNLPLVGVGLLVAFLCMPHHHMQPKVTGRELIAKFDILGVACNLVWPFLFATYVTLSGTNWTWTSGEAWALFTVTLVVGIVWLLSIVFSIFTAKEDKAIPAHLLSRRDLLPIFVASGCAGAAYAITIYYAPLFFAFTRGRGAMEQSVRLLPFILVFIVTIMLTGGLLPLIGRYQIIYLLGGASTLAGAAAMVATMDANVSEAQIMGLEALLGFGLGLHFQHGVGISNVINKNDRDRVDGAVLCNMSQMCGIAMMLAIAGSIFQNVGFSLLKDALGAGSYSDDDIREALAGVASSVWRLANEKVRRDAIGAVADVISREFIIVVASGALCLLAAACMKREKLDYGRSRKHVQEQPGTESP